jgi:acetolactate synthase-1/2/3 large subunit
MNGAEALIETLHRSGVEICFANPGTSEMQLVAAIDKHPDMRAVLGLFEGVVSGAADGYGRMAGKPAATLLHLGPGLANAAANLHNARRARTPIVNIIGDHATGHRSYDAPLTSDIESAARPFSDWVKTASSTAALARAGAEAVAAAQAGGIATLIAPANFAWEESPGPADPVAPLDPPAADDRALAAAAEALRAGEAALFLGGDALMAEALDAAGRIAEATGARIIAETFAARLQRGAGRVPVERLPYFGEMAADHLAGLKRIVLVGARPPVAFFAYPEKPGWLSPKDCLLIALAGRRGEAPAALAALAERVGAPKRCARTQARIAPPKMTGKLDAAGVAAALAELMPADAIVSDEAATAGLALFPMTAGAPPHDWLMLTGGSIGQGLPVGVGAALACPDRKVICLQADGSALYTIQSLWTMARETLDVTTVIFNNASYAILNIELARVGAMNPGPKALSLLDLSNPLIDWVALAEGFGVAATRADTAEGFRAALAEALAAKGPRLIEADIRP